MTGSAGPTAGDLREGDTGEVEMFDGQAWTPLYTLLADPDTGNRDGPPLSDTHGAAQSDTAVGQ
jgi:hypothetical protein